MGMEGKKRPISRIWPRREMKEDLQADPEKVGGLCGVLFLGVLGKLRSLGVISVYCPDSTE